MKNLSSLMRANTLLYKRTINRFHFDSVAVSYNFVDDTGALTRPLELPLLDYRATTHGMAKIPPQDLLWPQKVGDHEKEVGIMCTFFLCDACVSLLLALLV